VGALLGDLLTLGAALWFFDGWVLVFNACFLDVVNSNRETVNMGASLGVLLLLGAALRLVNGCALENGTCDLQR